MPPRRPVAPPTEASLERAALRYLERYSASSELVRKVLERRVARAGGHGGALEDPAEAAAMIATVMAKLAAAGLLDDARFAESRGNALLRRGSPLRGVRLHLAARGVEAEVIETALAELAGLAGTTPEELDRAAALAYARRRRLGPFRDPAARAAFRQRDLAAMARAGFRLALARLAIDGDGSEG